YIVVKPKARRVLFLLFSLLFYAWGGIGDACLLLLYVCLVYALGRYIGAVEKEHRTRRLTESMLLLGLLLFYYKYYGFFLDNLFAVLSVPVSYEVLPMPLGISFITFTAMAYLIDIRREVIQPASFLQLAVYLTFFPKLI
ncbi:MBOAT family protein, partial [Erysipelatoclostridium ramosum]|nr:MBOAT family protein [Thomasclavelia ramosa]